MSDKYIQTLEAKKRGNTLQVLMKCARLVNELAVRTLPTRPGPKPRTAHMALFPHIDHDGTRLTELARRLGVSKQAIGPLVDDLNELGLVERRPDPEDRRAKRVHFTEFGQQEILAGLDHLASVQRELELVVGSLDALHDRLLPLHDHLMAADA